MAQPATEPPVRRRPPREAAAAARASRTQSRRAARRTRPRPLRPGHGAGRRRPRPAAPAGAARPARRCASASALARQPGTVAQRAGELAREIGQGRRRQLRARARARRTSGSPTRPGPATRCSRRAMQAHLATARTAWELIEDADLELARRPADALHRDNLVDALAPSNIPFLNPLSLKAAIDTGGAQRRRGPAPVRARLRHPAAGALDGRARRVRGGRGPRASRRARWCCRTDVFELIQYTPQTTERSATVPLLIVPPTINKYYVIDLAPGRSLVEHLSPAASRSSCISWRNPDEPARRLGPGHLRPGDHRGDGRRARRSRGSEQVGAPAFCSGGMHHLDGAGPPRRDRRPRPGRGVQPGRHRARPGSRPGTVSALHGRRGGARGHREASREKGYLDGAELAEVFAWLRPNDLIWNYWVNNYLLGTPPQGLRHPLLERRPGPDDRRPCTATSSTSRSATRSPSPGGATMLGTPVDLGKVDRRLLRRRRHRRPPLPVAVLLPDHPAARRRQPSSCCPPAATSPRWSTRPATRRPPSRPRTSNPADAAGRGWRGAETVQGQLVADDYVDLARRALAAERDPAAPLGVGGATSRCATPRAPMSSTAEPPAGARARPDGDARAVATAARRRSGPGRTPSVDRRCCCATGSAPASRRCSRFVDALDPDRGVIRFDVPGVGRLAAARRSPTLTALQPRGSPR